MNLGDFFREKRKEVGISLQALAERTGVDIGTISRIENSRTKATVQSAARLCLGLRVHPEDLVQILDGIEINTLRIWEYGVSQEGVMLTDQDILDFLVLFQRNPSIARTWLVQNLNLLLDRQSYEQRRALESYGINIEYRIPSFILDDIDTLTITPPLYSFKLEYPAPLEPDTILEIYDQGGLLITADADTYIRQLRYKINGRSVSRLGDILKRLTIATVERAKADDVITLDKEVNAGGKFLGVCFGASIFDDRLKYLIKHDLRLDKYRADYAIDDRLSSIMEHDRRLNQYASAYANKDLRLAYTLIITNRWFYYYGLDTNWLVDMRQLIRHEL